MDMTLHKGYVVFIPEEYPEFLKGCGKKIRRRMNKLAEIHTYFCWFLFTPNLLMDLKYFQINF